MNARVCFMDTYGGKWYMKRVKHVIQPNWINSDILNAIKQRKYFHKKKDSVLGCGDKQSESLFTRQIPIILTLI